LKTWLVSAMLAAVALAATAAVIEGVVVEKSTGRPVARARVTLQPLQAPSSSSSSPLFTDSAGRFSLPREAGGAFLLSVEKGGYAPVYYGQRRWNGPGTPIVLEKDSRFAAEVSLSRLGAVTGEIVDENGIGLPDVPVFAYRDTRPPRLAGQGTSDDRGMFRVAGLQPGRYRVRTGPKQLEDGIGLLPTYFGNTVTAENANAVEVRLDEDTGGVSIRPAAGKLLRLSGRLSAQGAPSVTLYSDSGRRVAAVDSSGQFVFGELSPGRVELIAESGRGERPQTAYASLWLSADVDGFVLDPAPVPAVQFRCEEKQRTPLVSKDVTLTLIRTSFPEEPRTQKVDCGKTALAGVGNWRLVISTPPNYAVADVLIGRRPTGSNEVQFFPGQQVEIVLVVSPQVSGFSGTLRGTSDLAAAGAMVFLRATDESLARRIYQKGTARTDTDGKFMFEGLPPGRYKVAGSFDVQTADEVDWSDPSLPVVELEDGKELTQDLRMPARP
jgi:hypothetical protein